MANFNTVLQIVLVSVAAVAWTAIGGCRQGTDSGSTSNSHTSFLKDDLAATCRNADRKGNHELTDDEFKVINEVITFLTRMDAEYRTRSTAARNRDYATFVSPGNDMFNEANLAELVSANIAGLSEEAIESWRMYAKTYDSKRSDFRRESFSDPELDQYLSGYNVEEISKSATLGRVAYGQLLAAEAQLRLIRRELEIIWLLDVALNKVVVELPENELRKLPLDVTQTLLRAAELKEKSAIFGQPEDDTSPFKQPAFVPTEETKTEYRSRYSWLKNGPDSGRFEQAIESLQKIRSEYVPYAWPDALATSYFADRNRPVFENPFNNEDGDANAREADKRGAESPWQID